MVEINVVGLNMGVLLTLIAVTLHYSKGTRGGARHRTSPRGARPPSGDGARDRLPRADEPVDRWGDCGGSRCRRCRRGRGARRGRRGDGRGDRPRRQPRGRDRIFEVEFVKEGDTIEIANNKSILESGEENRWDLPYACRQGSCVSCAGQIQDGPSEDVVVHDNQQMLDDGYTPTCVAYPRDSFSIEPARHHRRLPGGTHFSESGVFWAILSSTRSAVEAEARKQ